MAKGRVMLQLEISQIFSSEISSVPPIEALVFDLLDGETTTVREIAAQKVAHLSAGSNVRALDTSSDNALTEVFLVSAQGEQPLTVFYGPSHVPSPPLVGPEMVILKVKDIGYSVVSPGKLIFGRVIQAHTYLDEAPGFPTLVLPPTGPIQS